MQTANHGHTGDVDDPLGDAARGCEHLRERLGVDRVAVWVFNETTRTLSPAVADTSARYDRQVGYERWMRTSVDAIPALREVLETQHEVVIDDMAADPRVPEAMVRDFASSSVRLVPLTAGAPVGVLAIEPAGSELDPDDRQLVRVLALDVGHAAARRQAEQQRQQAELLLALTEAAVRTRSVSQTLAEACQAIARHARMQRASLFLVEGGELVPRMSRYADGRSDPAQWRRFRRAASVPQVAEEVLATGEAQMAEGLGSELLSDWWPRSFGIGSALAVPVGVMPHVSGVLVLDDSTSRRFPAELVRLVAAVGAHLDTVVARARAEEERAWHVRTLGAVRELLQHTTRATSVAETGRILAEVARRAFDAERAGFVPVHGEGRDEVPPWAQHAPPDACRLVEGEASGSGHAEAVLPLVSGDERVGIVHVIGATPRWGRHHAGLAEQLALEARLLVDNALLREQEQRRLSELAHHATHDTLTGLPNRALLEDRLQQAVRQTARADHQVGLLFVDLDRFKRINDRFGHALADEVLVEVGRRLRESTRDEDTVARFAGDEFVIMVPRVAGVADVEALATRLRAHMSAPVSAGPADTEVYATLSIGMVTGSGPDVDARWLLRAADAAMYRAKHSGRSRDVVFDPAVDVLEHETLGLERDLHHALRRGELFLEYQPIVQVPGCLPVGFEALLRWQHPEHGRIPPLDFVPLAETTGLIHPIGRWVIEQACHQLAAWRRETGQDRLWCSVNVSPMQVHDPKLVGHVRQALDGAGLPPEALVLELTESSLVHEEDGAPALSAIHRLGTRIAIDDFGVGYSALSYLQRFPIDLLKVDKSFVAQLGEDPGGSAVARAVVAIARALDIPAIAEGVEDDAQLAVLDELGAQFGQGYHFARPLPADEVLAWVRERAGRAPM